MHQQEIMMQAAFANWLVDMFLIYVRYYRDMFLTYSRILRCDLQIMWYDIKIWWYS